MSHRSRLVTSLLPLLVVAAGVTACSSSDKGPATPTSPGSGATTPSSTPSTQAKGGFPVAPGNGEPAAPGS